MNVDIEWLKNADAINFAATSAQGHRVVMDSVQTLGAKPMELILMGLGGCASYDVVSILQKSRQAIEGVRCHVDAQRADAIPAVFTDIHLHFVVTGRNIKPAQVQKAIELSAEKYCSASRMLVAGGVNITHDFEIVELA